MTTFDNDLHPRAASGKFTDKGQSDPQVIFTGWADEEDAAPRTSAEVLEAALEPHLPIDRKPVGITQTRAALRNSRGEKDNGVRIVELTWDSVPPASNAGDFSVVGPKDGRPIIVRLRTGIPHIMVESGHAIILANSNAGNAIRVAAGARATVMVGEKKKISLNANPGSKVDMYAEPGAFGCQVINPAADFTLHTERGEDSRLSLSTDPKRY